MRDGLGLALLALALTLPAAAAGKPRATSGEIRLGATAPLSADGSSAAFARGADAYFRYVSARGGVHGRSISYRLVDDAADPAVALQATRHLVERDRVLALAGSLGTEQSLAARDYLNRARIPQLFLGSGATAWAREAGRFPWTIGYRPSNAVEGAILGRYVARTRPGGRVAVLADVRADGGELLAGLRRGVAGSTATIAAVERHDPAVADLRSQLARLRASGAELLALLVDAATATQAATAARRLGWRPSILTTAAGAVTEGAVSISIVKHPTDPRWAADPGMRLYRSILARHAPGADPREAGHVQGMAVAYTTVEVLRAAGPALSRAVLMAKARSLRSASNPFLLPGITVRTSPEDSAPIEQAMLQRRVKGSWRAFGGLWR